MNYKEFVKHIKSDETHNFYLLYGKERYLINWALEALKSKYLQNGFEDLNYNIIDIKTTNSDGIINLCETLPIMCEKRIVILDDFAVLEGEKVKQFNEDDEKNMAEYIDKIPSTTILVITCGDKVDKRKSMYKKVSKVKCAYEFSQLEVQDLKKWIAKRFKQSKKVINNANTTLLIELSGYYDKESDYSLYNLENDIEKLVHYVGNETEVQRADILEMIAGNIERNIFILIDSISLGKKEAAFNMLSHLLLYGEAEYKILSLLHKQFENLLRVKIMRESGKDIAYMKQNLPLPDFVINKLLKSASSFTEERLKKIIIKIYETDKNIKTGIMDAKMALEVLISQV